LLSYQLWISLYHNLSYIFSPFCHILTFIFLTLLPWSVAKDLSYLNSIKHHLRFYYCVNKSRNLIYILHKGLVQYAGSLRFHLMP
jgi:hypothetical protein